ncbi:unnamed protein product [Heligmosomoides polygyrus]|uniref:Uncharacterized protein n=1 Tax=Heligmosomoides polygyrus TaxID=6339 RepID=A0A183G244_HELPZ|nr:unnamed protein product [Heligmosomoides polygyrus]
MMDASRNTFRVFLQAFTQAVSAGHCAERAMKGVGLRPVRNHGAMLKLCLVTVSSLYLGGFLAHKGASYFYKLLKEQEDIGEEWKRRQEKEKKEG